jgi:hypothetical protein
MSLVSHFPIFLFLLNLYLDENFSRQWRVSDESYGVHDRSISRFHVGTHIFWVDNFDLTNIWIVSIHIWVFKYKFFISRIWEFQDLTQVYWCIFLNYFMGYPKISITRHGVMSIVRLIANVCGEHLHCLLVFIGFVWYICILWKFLFQFQFCYPNFFKMMWGTLILMEIFTKSHIDIFVCPSQDLCYVVLTISRVLIKF